MSSLIRSIVMSILAVSIAGCSESRDDSVKESPVSLESLESEKDDTLSRLKETLFSGLEGLSLSEDIFQHEPVAADILRQELPSEKLKKYDRARFEEKARLIQKSAAEAGVKLQSGSPIDTKSIRDMGTRFGLSEERIAELEALALAQKEKTKPIDGMPETSPATMARTTPPANPTPPSPRPQGQSAASIALPSLPAPPFVTTPGQNHSTEMREIIRRREERLREALKVDPNP
ncbi:MAG: hypothetical protein HQL76_15020 [Magnetococcales bacterium]|nr:hypothetical protein [Magnetococcales bacterium]